jgi:uncharacterized Zn-binding protein involved in type VI secretion
MGKAARIGDKFSCGDNVAAGSPDVFINGVPAARKGDATTGHGKFPPTKVAEGAATVFVNGIPLAYEAHKNVPHCDGSCHQGSLTSGSGDVSAES